MEKCYVFWWDSACAEKCRCEPTAIKNHDRDFATALLTTTHPPTYTYKSHIYVYYIYTLLICMNTSCYTVLITSSRPRQPTTKFVCSV